MSTITLRGRPPVRGYTLIEMLIVLGIIGIFLVVSYPSILNVMEVRNLENTTRQVQSLLQQAKLRAVDTKINHRVRFFRPTGTYWAYEIEEAQADLAVTPPTVTWVQVPGAPRKTIPERFQVVIALPVVGSDHVAEYSPVGAMVNYSADQNTIVIQSLKLYHSNQMDERVVSLFMGGSIQYAKRRSS